MQISKWVALGVAAFCLVAVGGVVNMPHLYYMAAMLVTLPAVSYLLGWLTLRGLEFKREIPSPIWEGEETDIVYTVSNRSRLARFFLAIQEPTNHQILSLEMNPPLFTIAPNDTVRVRNRVKFTRRGVYETGSFDVSALDPLGVFTFTRTIAASGEAVVYPTPRQMPPLDLGGADRLGWNDARVRARSGDGVDCSGVRGYMPGDPLRRIHWRQTARTGQLTVIEFDETQSLDLKILLDTNIEGVVGEEPDTSLEYAVRVAATVARDCIQSGATVELIVPNQANRPVSTAWNGLIGERGDSRLYGLLDILARVEPQSVSRISDLIVSSLINMPRGTTVLIICLKPDPDLVTAIANCIVGGSNASVVFVDEASFRRPGARSALQSVDLTVAETASLAVPVFVLSQNSDHTLHVVPLD